MMDELSREYVISYYNRILQMFGDRPESLRWTARGQLQRYRSLLEIDRNLTGRKVLDYGCGKGDFYKFLKDQHISVHYSGFDINENLIFLAQEKFPECTFRVFDTERENLEEDFDFIFLCGVFNLKVKGINGTIEKTLLKLFQHCRIALAFNALSSYSQEKDFELHYIVPEKIFTFAVKNLSRFVTIRHEAVSSDLTMFVYRDKGVNKGKGYSTEAKKVE